MKQDGMLTVDGVDVFVEGTGPETLLMIHGWPDTHQLWDSLVAYVRSRYACARFTLPGYDLTKPARPMSLEKMLTFFGSVVDRVSPNHPITLVLHDWGCIFGYEFAARFPKRVARVVGVDIGDHNSEAFLRALSARAKLGVLYYQFGLALAWFIRGSLGNAITRHMARFRGCPVDAASVGWQMNYPYAMRWLGVYGGLRNLVQVTPRCPTLFIYGEQKKNMWHSPEWLSKIAATPGCKAVSLPTSHWVMLDQPQEFDRSVDDWLSQTRGLHQSAAQQAVPGDALASLGRA